MLITSDMLQVEAQICGKWRDLIFDTGAGPNVIGECLLEELGKVPVRPTRKTTRLLSAFGHSIVVEEEAIIDILFTDENTQKQKVVRIPFLIASNFPYDILIGTRTMRDMGLLIDFRRNCVHVSDDIRLQGSLPVSCRVYEDLSEVDLQYLINLIDERVARAVGYDLRYDDNQSKNGDKATIETNVSDYDSSSPPADLASHKRDEGSNRGKPLKHTDTHTNTKTQIKKKVEEEVVVAVENDNRVADGEADAS